MKERLLQPAATIAAALIARMEATMPNNGVTTTEITSAYLQAMEALERAEIEQRDGRWISPQHK